MKKQEVKARLMNGEGLREIFPVLPYTKEYGEIVKAARFVAGDEVIYIPSLGWNPINYFAENEEDAEDILCDCYTGDNYIELCNGNITLAKLLFSITNDRNPYEEYEYYFENDDYPVGNIGKASTYQLTPDDQMISVCVYRDTTELYTMEECDEDNLADLDFPLSLLREFYESNQDEFVRETMYDLGIPAEKATFDVWRKEVYTADSTDGFYNFCAERGYYAQREDN